MGLLDFAYTVGKDIWANPGIRLVFQKQMNLLVLGSTGTGKTLFVKSLKESWPNSIDYLDRTQHPYSKKLKLRDRKFNLVDTPGQFLHRDRRNNRILQLVKNQPVGIINVVSYGYHEYYNLEIEGAFEGKRKVSKKFLEEHRQLEITDLRDWAGSLSRKLSVSWMITLITKADLWWSERAKVKDYYENGAYARAVQQYAKIPNYTMEYCSAIQKFYALGPTSGDFDQASRMRLKHVLENKLIQATQHRD